MKLRKYTEEQLRKAVKDSFSIRQALKKLNVVEAGGNYTTFKKAVKYFDIDTSHFRGQGWNKGMVLSMHQIGKRGRPLKDYLSNKYTILSHKLKKKLLKACLLEFKCYNCGITTWNGEKAPLELHHKDGDPLNNKLENLEILCPNCHALTNTYRTKNLKNK